MYDLTSTHVVMPDGSKLTPKQMTRSQLIDFCVWNDRNGCFTDEEAREELGKPLTDADLRHIVRHWMNDTGNARFFRLQIVRRKPNKRRSFAPREAVEILNDTSEHEPQTITRGKFVKYLGCGMYYVRVYPEYRVDALDEGYREVSGEILRKARPAQVQ